MGNIGARLTGHIPGCGPGGARVGRPEGRGPTLVGLTACALALLAMLSGAARAAAGAPHLSSPAPFGAGGVHAVYVGRSDQGFTVRLGRPGPAGRTFTYRATMRCNDGTTFTDRMFSDVVGLNRAGRFQVRFVTDRGATVTDVRGTVRGRRASGTIRIGEHYSGQPNAQGNSPLDPHGSVWCQSPTVHWRASAR